MTCASVDNKMKVLMNKVLSTLNVNYKKLLILSLIIIFIGGFMSFLFVPQLVKIIVKQLGILKPGRYIRNLHETKLPFTYKLYLWNITNSNEIAAGIEKPNMQQIGPYVFSQSKQKIDTTDNDTEDSLSFNLRNIYNFNAHLSAPLTGDETVTLLNFVLVSGLVKVKLESPQLLNTATEGMNAIFENPSSIFRTMKAKEFINDGILINCNQTAFAAKAVCREMRKFRSLKIINEDKTLLRQRWFDKLNNSIQARYTVLRGSKNTDDIGRLIALNEKPKLSVYRHEESCNVFNGTDKMFFPPFQSKRETVWIFSEDACKSLPLVFAYMKTLRGTKTAWKSLYLSDPLMDPACNCNQYTGCNTIKGTIDMHSCLDLFVMGSLPHFYLAEPSIRETVVGMDPKEQLHKTGIYFDLITGIPVHSLERFQVNFLVIRIPEIPIFSSIAAGDIWIPTFWYEESFTVSKKDLALIIFSRMSKMFGVITGYILICLGTVGCILAAILYYNRDVSKLKQVVPNSVESTISIAIVQPIENRDD